MDYVPVFDHSEYHKPISRLSTNKILDMHEIPVRDKKPPKPTSTYIPYARGKENVNTVNGPFDAERYLIPQLKSNTRTYKSIEPKPEQDIYSQDSSYKYLRTFNNERETFQDPNRYPRYKNQVSNNPVVPQINNVNTTYQDDQSFFQHQNHKYDHSVSDFMGNNNNSQQNASLMSFYENYMNGEREKNLDKYEQVYENIKRGNQVSVPQFTKPPLYQQPYRQEQQYQQTIQHNQERKHQIILEQPKQFDLEEQQSTMKQLYKSITNKEINIEELKEKYQFQDNYKILEKEKKETKQEKLDKYAQLGNEIQQQQQQVNHQKNNSSGFSFQGQEQNQNQTYEQSQNEIIKKESNKTVFEKESVFEQEDNDQGEQELQQKLEKEEKFRQRELKFQRQELEKQEKRERARSYLQETKKLLEKDDKRLKAREIMKDDRREPRRTSQSRQRFISLHRELSQNNIPSTNIVSSKMGSNCTSQANISIDKEDAKGNYHQYQNQNQRVTISRDCVHDLDSLLHKYKKESN